MAETKLYGLIGNPLEHSFSRDYFTRFFAREAIDAEYRNFELADIGELMELIAEYPQLKGLNVTSPYKQAVIPYIDKMTADAEAIGAVNVIRITGDADNPVFEGHNTDAAGFMADILPFIDRSGKALVLGSGGASKAVVFGLRKAGIDVTIVSRRPSADGLSYDNLTAEIMKQVKTIVNATPLGMVPHIDECPPIPYDLVNPSMLCYDLIYNPSPTVFMQQCARRGAAVKSGLGMLINQADLSWKIWNEQ